jgi:hypothetical protein
MERWVRYSAFFCSMVSIFLSLPTWQLGFIHVEIPNLGKTTA